MFDNLNSQGVSVVIVTYNGKSRIRQTLNHLVIQEGFDFPWEVILVDNNSNDNTANIASDYWKQKRLNVPFITINEKRPGTMYARYTGIVSANYRYLLFVDDDNWLSEEYVKMAYDTIKKDSKIAAVGGRGIMKFEKGFDPPRWADRFEKSYGCGPQGKSDGDTTYDQGWLYTAGAILDRVWLDRLYAAGFESALKGRDGKSLAPGEDSELTFALKIIGGRLHYSSLMTFRHFMPAVRINWQYLIKLWFASGYVDFVLLPYRKHWSNKRSFFCIKHVLSVFKSILLNFFLALFDGFLVGNVNTLKLLRNLGEIKGMLINRSSHRKARNVLKALNSKPDMP